MGRLTESISNVDLCKQMGAKSLTFEPVKLIDLGKLFILDRLISEMNQEHQTDRPNTF